MMYWLLTALLFVLSLSGAGLALLYDGAFVCVVMLLLRLAFVERAWGGLIVLALYAVLVLLAPSIVWSACFIACGLFLVGERGLAQVFLGSQLCVLVGALLPLPFVLCSPWLAGAIFVILFVLLRRCWLGRLLCCLPWLYAVLLMIVSLQGVLWQGVADDESKAGFGIGASLSRVLGDAVPDGGHVIFDSPEERSLPADGALYLDHDARTVLDSGDDRQPRPWGAQVLIASEPIRMAARRDGGLVMNWGASLLLSEGRLLYGQLRGLRLQPLALRYGGRLLLSDSDYVVDSLAPYQWHLIRRMAGVDVGFMCFHLFASALLLFFMVLPRWGQLMGLALGLLLYLCLCYWPRQGDVRLLGGRYGWPHSSLSEGLLRRMQVAGEMVVFADRGARVLAVAAGRRGTVQESERLVFLESGASVELEGYCVAAARLPLGMADGIKDGRELMIDGRASGGCSWVSPAGRVIIGTGSPAGQLDEVYLR